ncbi:MAG: hypothetical protein KA758_15900, partial [Acidimicrobiales bacterium]|nr:hypothetical protein [Acidimicrobiales bacterium]
DAAVAANAEHLAMLRTLEQTHDAQAQAGPDLPPAIPSADELAAEVERFLRDQGGVDPTPDDDPGDLYPDDIDPGDIDPI